MPITVYSEDEWLKAWEAVRRHEAKRPAAYYRLRRGKDKLGRPGAWYVRTAAAERWYQKRMKLIRHARKVGGRVA